MYDLSAAMPFAALPLNRSRFPLAVAVAGSSRVGTAIEAMEVLVGFLQAAKILAIEKDTTVPMQVIHPPSNFVSSLPVTIDMTP